MIYNVGNNRMENIEDINSNAYIYKRAKNVEKYPDLFFSD